MASVDTYGEGEDIRTEADLDNIFTDMNNEMLLRDLCNDYAEYLRVDIGKEKKTLDESIDELLLRLDEFMSLIDMVRSDDSLCLNRTLPEIHTKMQELENIFSKTDRLEAFVKLVKQNVETMDLKVTEAEKDLNTSGSNSLTRVFRPLFKKKSDASGSSEKKVLKYDPPEIFKTSDYFPERPDSCEAESEIAANEEAVKA